MASGRRSPGRQGGDDDAPRPKRQRNPGTRAHRWIITLNDKVALPPSARWTSGDYADASDHPYAQGHRGEEKEEVGGGARRAEEEEDQEDPSADGGLSPRARRLASGRRHFRHPTELFEKFDADSQLLYFIGQLERGPQDGVLHYHFFLRFKNAVAFSRVVSLFGPESGVHVEVAHDEAASILYCSKVSTRVMGPWERGERAKQGKRNDVMRAREIVKEGGGMRRVLEEVNSYQAAKSAQLQLTHLEKGRDWKSKVFWFHGSTGGGKTRRAFEFFKELQEGGEIDKGDEAWISAKNLQWTDGYDAHVYMIIDDFRKDFCTFHELLRMLDRYPYRMAYKGGFRQLLAKWIIITCPWKPEVLYASRSDEDIGQLVRRIDEVQLFGSEVPAPGLGNVVNPAPHFRAGQN